MSAGETRKRVIIATSNRGKIAEMREALSLPGWEFLDARELGFEPLEVEETGTTFEENAVQKARAYAERYRLPALADDSGLEVDALGGAPGVRSARYAGEGATDEATCLRASAAPASVAYWRSSGRKGARSPSRERARAASASCRAARTGWDTIRSSSRTRRPDGRWQSSRSSRSMPSAIAAPRSVPCVASSKVPLTTGCEIPDQPTRQLRVALSARAAYTVCRPRGRQAHAAPPRGDTRSGRGAAW